MSNSKNQPSKNRPSKTRQRLESVLVFINQNLEGDLGLEQLSLQAQVSKFHFHRQFKAYFGITANRFIWLTRLKRAGYQLVFRSKKSITDIGLDAGFENAESFSRAFKQLFLQTPSQFRKKPDWTLWNEHFSELHFHLKKNRKENSMEQALKYQVDIIEFEQVTIATLEHRGAPQKLMSTVRRFIEWRQSVKLSPKNSRTFNLLYDDPSTTPEDEYRFDISASIHSSLQANDFGVIEKQIPAGRCAVVRHVGSDIELGDLVEYLYSSWLPESNESLRDFPCYFERIRFFPDVPEHEMITDVYLPLI